MYFNDWKVTINGKGSHDVVTNEDTLLILQDYQHVEIALKLVNDTIQVKSLGYGEDVSNKYSLDYNDIDFSMSNFEIEDKTMQQEITEYLREIIKSTLKISDFGLVERSHEDKEWKNNITHQEVMNNDLIIKEYIGLVNA